ncbi:hypothetical protein N8T08_008178 [Aspergillus melleus]|uniref:Uncharacterized protein n=1 Tax=Aspergillus melleus TaxID=138277 RepID=A0ACC3AWQ3_9EURO|nr:hypothetical protein N8T08_008178 [Aspergillus melleus]
MSRTRVYARRPHHVIEGKYMDPKRLVSLLRDEYGQYNFRVELRLDTYKIYVSDHTTAKSAGLTEVRSLPPVLTSLPG